VKELGGSVTGRERETHKKGIGDKPRMDGPVFQWGGGCQSLNNKKSLDGKGGDARVQVHYRWLHSYRPVRDQPGFVRGGKECSQTLVLPSVPVPLI